MAVSVQFPVTAPSTKKTSPHRRNKGIIDPVVARKARRDSERSDNMRKFSTELVWHMPPVDYALTAGYLQAGPEHQVDVTDWAVELESKTDYTEHA